MSHVLRVIYFSTSLLLGFGVLFASTPAEASQGYAQTWGGVMVANANQVGDGGQWGAGAQFGLLAGITDFWSIVGGVETSHHFASSIDADPPVDLAAVQVLGLFGGFRYNLDLFKYVPYVGLAIENYILAPPAQPGDTGPNIGAKLSVGLDWRFDRHYALGALIELHTALDDPGNFPIYSSLGVNFSYHFRL